MICLALVNISVLSAGCEPVTAAPLKAPRHGGIYVIAHRGAHNGIPENTLAAYRKAIELNVDFVEIDARMTKDGKIVSIHNATVDAYTEDAKGPVKGFTFDELRAMDIGSRVGPEWKNERVPSLEEALDTFKGKVGVYIDMKDAPVEQVAAEVIKRGMEHDAVWYITPPQVETMRKVCPECVEMPDPIFEAMLPVLLSTVRPRVVASSADHFTKTFAEKCHKLGVKVFVDDDGPDTWERLLADGADGIQTDEPAELIAFLEKRATEKK